MPRRRPAPAGPPPVQPERIAARIVEAVRGGPIRLVITGRKRIPTGHYGSVKGRRAMPWEGRAERDLCVLAEADPGVADYLVQPHRLEIAVGERRPLVYIPDARHVLADGTIEILEVKRARQRLRPDYVRKIELAARVYAGLGWRYRVVLDSEIRREPRLSNARMVAGDKSTVVPVDAMLAAVGHVSAAGGSTYGAVADVLGDGPLGTARLHALVVARVLTLDLDRRIRPDTPVSLVPDRRAAGVRR